MTGWRWDADKISLRPRSMIHKEDEMMTTLKSETQAHCLSPVVNTLPAKITFHVSKHLPHYTLLHSILIIVFSVIFSIHFNFTRKELQKCNSRNSNLTLAQLKHFPIHLSFISWHCQQLRLHSVEWLDGQWTTNVSEGCVFGLNKSSTLAFV
jgi:hypothetical protein